MKSKKKSTTEKIKNKTKTSKPKVSNLDIKKPKPINPTARRYSPSEKTKILEEAKTKSQKELSKEYGVSKETIRRWIIREKCLFKSSEKNKKEQFSGSHPNWGKVVEIWKSTPGLGPQQICNQMKRQNIKINVATVRLIMEENGYTPPKTVFKEARVHRYEAARPLEMVHMDFKHFYINKQKVYLLLMQDDFSRFITGYKMTDSENMHAVIETFEMSINRHGKMQTLITDGGSAFYSWNGINQFQKLISEEYGIDHIKASSPRSNGKIESVNKQIEKEVLKVKMFSNLEEADQGISEWIQFYNFARTHMGLPERLVPADRFLPGWNDNQQPPKSSNQAQMDQLKEIAGNDNSMWLEILKVVINKLK